MLLKSKSLIFFLLTLHYIFTRPPVLSPFATIMRFEINSVNLYLSTISALVVFLLMMPFTQTNIQRLMGGGYTNVHYLTNHRALTTALMFGVITLMLKEYPRVTFAPLNALRGG